MNVSATSVYYVWPYGMQGITSIRAYDVKNTKHMKLANLLDGNNTACILFQHVSRWLSFRLDLAAAVCVTVTALLVVLFHNHIAPGIAGMLVRLLYFLSHVRAQDK